MYGSLGKSEMTRMLAKIDVSRRALHAQIYFTCNERISFLKRILMYIVYILYIHIHTHIYIYVFMYICIFICVTRTRVCMLCI